MTHPDSGGEYDAQPSQVPFLRESGWLVVPGQAEQGEEFPPELQRFEGQPEVRMRHPDIEGDPIRVAESAVPFHREKGWQVLDEDAERALDGLTVEELKEELRARDLPVSGSKAELVERLRPVASQEPPNQDSESPAEPASEEGEGGRGE